MKIRAFTPQDLPQTKEAVKQAFWRDGKNDSFNEWEFIEKVLEDPAFIPELCLIAESESGILGYVLLTEAMIGSSKGLTLGPLAVVPRCQKQGIGKELMQAGIKAAAALGYHWVALLGGDYYWQFGFEPAASYGAVITKDHPENKYLKLLFLNEAAKEYTKGEIRFCSSFYNEAGELL